MNNRMNDFAELRERAREEDDALEHMVTCPRCGERVDSRMLHGCDVRESQEASEEAKNNTVRSNRDGTFSAVPRVVSTVHDSITFEVPMAPVEGETPVQRQARVAEELRRISRNLNIPILTAQQRSAGAVPPAVPQAQPGTRHDVRTCECLACAHRRVRENVTFQVNCLGCGQLKDIGTLCPCGYTAERERVNEQGVRASERYVQEVAGRYRHFGTVTGRLSSEPAQQHIVRDYSDLEVRVLANLLQARRDGATFDTQAMAYLMNENAEGLPVDQDVRNVPCEVCGRVERIFASMCADGRYTCRRCREVSNNRESYIAEQLQAASDPNPRFVYDAKCNSPRCSRTAQRFTTIAACRDYVLVRNRICPTCHFETLGVQEVDTQREVRRQAAADSARETILRTALNPPPRRQDVPFTPAEREDPTERDERIRREQMRFRDSMGMLSDADRAEYHRRLAEEQQAEERARNTFKPARKLDLDD